MNHRIHRNRFIYFLIALLGLALAQATRRYPAFFPGLAATYGGDYFYGLVGYGLLGMVFPRLRVWQLGLATLLWVWAMEFQQLIRAGWLNDLRMSSFGRLFLGNTFVWSDVWALGLGALTATGLEYAWYRLLQKGGPPPGEASAPRA